MSMIIITTLGPDSMAGSLINCLLLGHMHLFSKMERKENLTENNESLSMSECGLGGERAPPFVYCFGVTARPAPM